MKAEQRKQLETNVLADRMGRLVKDVRQGPKRRTILIWVAVVGVVIAAIVGWAYWQNQVNMQAELWTKVMSGTRTDLVNSLLAKENDKTTQNKIARFQVAWILLWEQGVKDLFKGAAFVKSKNQAPPAYFGALKNIESAEEEYKKLFEECKDDPVLAPEALYCIAIAQETLSIRDLENLKAAKTTFKTLVGEEKYSNSAFAKKAAKRLKSYTNEAEYRRLRQFYSQLHDSYRERWGELDAIGKK